MLRAIAVAVACVIGSAAIAQEHHHPPQDAAIHETFYKDWMRPDDRRYSCCNQQDCAPTMAAEKRNGVWWAQRASDQKWLPIPHEKVERERDSPDPRAHMCSIGDTVFCFIAGSGS